MKQHIYTLSFMMLFTCLLFRMSMYNPKITKEQQPYIDDKCPHNTLEPSKQLSGTLVYLKRFKTFTMDERRKAISDKLRKI